MSSLAPRAPAPAPDPNAENAKLEAARKAADEAKKAQAQATSRGMGKSGASVFQTAGAGGYGRSLGSAGTMQA